MEIRSGSVAFLFAAVAAVVVAAVVAAAAVAATLIAGAAARATAPVIDFLKKLRRVVIIYVVFIRYAVRFCA
jgi:hypothetical protein